MIYTLLDKTKELDMRKRSATAIAADFNVVKAYFELKRLREDIESERSSGLPSSQVSAVGRSRPKGDDDVQHISRPQQTVL